MISLWILYLRVAIVHIRTPISDLVGIVSDVTMDSIRHYLFPYMVVIVLLDPLSDITMDTVQQYLVAIVSDITMNTIQHYLSCCPH